MKLFQKKPALWKNEVRRYRRIPLDLPARIKINSIDEYKGVLINMSPGDLSLKCDAKAVVGDAVVIYVSGLDVIEGTVVRKLPDGFAVSFMLSKRRRATLTEQLILRANPAFTDGLQDRRRAPRHLIGEQRTICRLPDGSTMFAKILDRSVDGMSLDARKRPEIGAVLHVGQDRAVVVRHTPRGFVAAYAAEDAEKGEDAQASHLRAV